MGESVGESVGEGGGGGSPLKTELGQGGDFSGIPCMVPFAFLWGSLLSFRVGEMLLPKKAMRVCGFASGFSSLLDALLSVRKIRS